MSIDDSVLANIKTQNESDDDGETFIEVLGRFNEHETSLNYDPLYEGDDEVERKKFKWQCDETQFIKPYKAEKDDIVGPSKKKIAKSELRSLNGQVWSKVKCEFHPIEYISHQNFSFSDCANGNNS